jgi:ketosteroid isomerase-like protein
MIGLPARIAPRREAPMSAVETVQEIYAAFGRGEVPAILERLAPEVEWEYGGTREVPWLEPRSGREGAKAFFESLAAIEIRSFAVKRLLADGPLVVALVDIEFTVRATGKRVVEEDEVHLWHLDGAHRVRRFRHRVDTLAHRQALTP